jgi:Fibronectin type III domain
LALICLAGFVGQSCAQTACPLTLEWRPSPDSGVAGYALYYGASGAPLTNRLDVGLQTAAVVEELTASVEYSFYVVAYDGDQNEGDPSDLLVYTAQAISPLGLTQSSDCMMTISLRVLPGAPCTVEFTDTLAPPNWQLLITVFGDSNGDVVVDDPIEQPSRFYRAVVQQ